MEFPEHEWSGWFLSCREVDFHPLFSMKWKARGCKGDTQKVMWACLPEQSKCVSDHKSEEWMKSEQRDCKRTCRPDTHFPKAKHSSFTEDPLETGRVSGNCTSILGSYSPITAAWRIKDKANQSKHTTWTHSVPNLIMDAMWLWPSWQRLWQRAGVCIRDTTAFVLTGGWVWIKFLPQLKSEALHSNSRDCLYCVWQAPRCAGAYMCFCHHGTTFAIMWLCAFMQSVGGFSHVHKSACGRCVGTAQKLTPRPAPGD